MRFTQGSNPVRSRQLTHSAILRTIYHYGPLRRGDVAQRLGLTMPTITNSVNKLIAQGLVREIDEPVSTASIGRKAHQIDVVSDAKCFAGVELRGSLRAACITDYRGNILYSGLDETICEDYDRGIQMACGLLCQLMDKCGLTFEKISGVAFCVPGLVDSASGILKMHPGYNWVNKDIAGDVSSLTGYRGPVSVENNACARSTSAQMFQRDLLNPVDTFAYLFIAAGIACPFVLNTANFFGSMVGAGEVGHMVMDPNGPVCVCGNHGCLEAFSSDHAVIDACTRALRRKQTAILERLCTDGGAPTMEQILAAQSAGDAAVSEIIRSALFMLGIAIANITNFSGPQMMLIEGKLFRNIQNQTYLRDIITQNLYSSIHSVTEFTFVEANDFSGALGAAAVAISRDLELCT